VKREREGREGFLVFAPFVTSIAFTETEYDPELATKK